MDMSGGFLANGRGRPITYSCRKSNNQQWSGITPSDNLLLTMLTANNLVVLRSLNIE
ncbi:hypothetical protein [Stenotrophomonas sp. Iso1]|uniref:hypothetical protein n=1 Tax=Stenotrophomonas sp. Iso1 TaxID=2977283 RepID=UPI0022B7AE35|nr:hypothetical protein [Stenotrophomonas sp. Iso1]